LNDPPPMWVAIPDFLAAAVLLAGAFFGGELVYRHGVGVWKDSQG